MTVTRPALRYHGAKFRLAPWILRFFPAHDTYVEPFGGAAGVLLQKSRARAEVYNDLDGEIVGYFRVLRDPDLRQQLVEALTLTPYARAEFEGAYEPTDDPVEQARRLCVRASMGFGSAGASKGSTGFRIDTARDSTAQQVWVRFPEGLAAIGQRFTGVLIENRDALQCMTDHDGAQTLHYVDPPYVLDARVLATAGGRCYRHELTDAQHHQLLDGLLRLQGMVVLSGYPHPLYDSALTGWERHETRARISAGRGTALRTEVVWLNPACSRSLHQLDLFGGSAA